MLQYEYGATSLGPLRIINLYSDCRVSYTPNCGFRDNQVGNPDAGEVGNDMKCMASFQSLRQEKLSFEGGKSQSTSTSIWNTIQATIELILDWLLWYQQNVILGNVASFDEEASDSIVVDLHSTILVHSSTTLDYQRSYKRQLNDLGGWATEFANSTKQPPMCCFFTPCTCARGKATNQFVCLLSAEKKTTTLVRDPGRSLTG